jgi:hypothetical protein
MEIALYSNWAPRATNSVDYLELFEWAKDYQKRGQTPQPAYKRFWIMEYQIPQALAYKGKEPNNYSEGLAALIVNAMIFAGTLDLPIFNFLKFKKITEVPKAQFDAMKVLIALGNCWQMIHYSQAPSKRHRSRYSEEKLAQNLSFLIEAFSSYLPEGHESQAIQDTTDILTHAF